MSECCGKALVWARFSPRWADYPIEGAHCRECGLIFERKAGGETIYVELPEFSLKCLKCETPIATIAVTHKIEDGVERYFGEKNRIRVEAVPYCPKCEEKPDFHGNSIPIGKLES